MKAPLVSIVCVSHGRRELLLRCLESCSRQDHHRKEIVVVLNPGEPAVESEIAARFPAVRMVRTHRNIGFFPALNIAIANATGDYIMTVDDDARFLADDALSRLLDCFVDEPALGAVTCNLEGPREVPVEGPDRYFREFTTGFTMMPRQVFTDWVGFYPDLFFRSGGETYVCSALWDQGRPVKKVSGVRMYHEWAGTGRSRRDQYFFGLRSQLLCALMRDPLPMIPLVLLSKLVRSALFFMRKGMAVVWLPAVLSAICHAPSALSYRRPMRMATWRLMRLVDRQIVTDLGELERRFGFRLAGPI
ncbi:MAG TPA: glycosyltransferase [Verrucomicrobiae bacterium]|nr:glycosyltransferase [Verrucomicrobiae bacterium]